jgi:hypothetical protein
MNLKDDNDPHRDAAIPSYGVLPLSWSNGGRGGINMTAVSPGGSKLGAVVTAFTGQYTLRPAVLPPATNGSRYSLTIHQSINYSALFLTMNVENDPSLLAISTGFHLIL